jgi:ABC-type transport system involved in cytochrome c biogenesis permease component
MVWKDDLSERLDPMTAKELRQNLRRGSFVYPFLAVQGLAVAATALEFQGNAGVFWWVAAGICLVLMPMGGLTLMGQELEAGNHELLLLTKLDRWKVVLGKFISLWGLCVLTFISLLPYVVVRYLIGGVEWTDEASLAAMVIGGSAMICAGAIGASAFRRTATRLGVMVLFLGAAATGSSIPLAAAGGVSRGMGVVFYFTAICGVVCYCMVGLALARSRLRLSFLEYEANPTGMLLGLLVFSPFVTGMVTAVTLGFGGGFGLLAIAFAAATMDATPKAPRWIPALPTDMPKPRRER